MRLRRTSSLSFALIALTYAFILAAENTTQRRAECAFSADAAASPRALYQRLSLQTEVVAPSSRRRAVARPPELPPIRNFIDEEIFGKMKANGIRWTVQARDEEFLRRVFLDLTGQIPPAEKVKSFLADTSADKRDKVIEELLLSEEFVDRWTLWFGDLVENVQFAPSTNTRPFFSGMFAFYTFIRDSIREDKPYDQMVRETINAKGRSFTNGPVNYWARQTVQYGPFQETYDNLSADTGEKFLGIPLNCVSCHDGLGHLETVNTSLARRTREDFWKNAAFFARDYGRLERPAGDIEEGEWVVDSVASGLPKDVTVYYPQALPPGEYTLDTTSGNRAARKPKPGQPSTVDPAFFLSGEAPRSGELRRDAYARILTAHPQFARATVNYIWKEIFAIGIVEPANSHDLLRQDPASLASGQTLQPTHPQLLTRLADHFVGNGYSLRALLKTIVSSSAYQLSSTYTPGAWNENWTPYYARRYRRRVLAESVADAIARATGVPLTSEPGLTIGPTMKRAMQLPDPQTPGPIYNYETRRVEVSAASLMMFINAFGRGNRDTMPRANHGSIVEAMRMLNHPFVTTRVKAENNSTVQRILAKTIDPGTIADELYIATLSRRPTPLERSLAIDLLAKGDLTRNTEDLQFALINHLEFLYN